MSDIELRGTMQIAEHIFVALLLAVLVPSYTQTHKNITLGQHLFFRESIRLLSSETTGYLLNCGAGVVVAVMLSHLPTTLAAGRHITALAGTASAALSPTKHANCQPVDSIQLLAGVSGAFMNRAFAQKK